MKGPVYFALVSNSAARKNCRCGLLATPTQKCRSEKIKSKQRRQREEQKDPQLPRSSCKRKMSSCLWHDLLSLLQDRLCLLESFSGWQQTSRAKDKFFSSPSTQRFVHVSLLNSHASANASCLVLPHRPSEKLSH